MKSCSCERRDAKSTPPAYTEVELLGVGSEPRVELRVTRWSGLHYRIVLETTGTVALEGQPAVPGPTVVMSVRHDVLVGSADPLVVRRDAGILRMVEERGVIESVTVRHALTPQPIVDAWNQALIPLRGTSFKQRVAEDDAVTWMRSELLGGLQPPLEVTKVLDAGFEAQRHFPFRLPPAPVGIGARWRFRERLHVNGVDAVQVAEMSLRSLDDRVATVVIRLTQEAPKQEVPHPLVPGKLATMDVFRGDGEGEVTVDRMTAIPLTGRLTSMARLTLSGEVNGVHGQATLLWTSQLQARGSLLDEDAGGAAQR
jgi:hypothetical protein